jgi:hypothetical protein
MKQITNKTILNQGDKTYQPIEVNGVIYWVDKEAEIKEYDAVIVLEELIIDRANDRTNYHKDKFKLVVAQSQSKLDGIPVVSLDSYIDKQKNDSWTVVSSMFPKLIFTLFSRIFKDGYESNPNQYTQADIEKAIELAETSGSVEMGFDRSYNTLADYNKHVKTKEQILEEINSISVIEVDEDFNVINFE